MKTKIWYITDIHGSTPLFDAFLKCLTTELRPNVLIIGGDLLGQGLVPIVKQENGTWTAGLEGYRHLIETPDDLKLFSISVERKGLYPVLCDSTEEKRLRAERLHHEKTLQRLQQQRLESWLSRASSAAQATDVQIIINSGHSDPLWVDAVLEAESAIVWPEGKLVPLPDGSLLASTGWSIESPFHCQRETSEELLASRIDDLFKGAVDGSRLIFNFHTPPRNTLLDKAYRIDESGRPQLGPVGPHLFPAGSTAVRNAIQRWKPILSLHGLIHECSASQRLGHTVVINPGSEHYDGWIRGAFAQVGRKGLEYFKVVRLDSKPDDEKFDKAIRRISQVVVKNMIPFLGELIADRIAAKELETYELAALYALQLAEKSLQTGDEASALLYARHARLLAQKDSTKRDMKKVEHRADAIVSGLAGLIDIQED